MRKYAKLRADNENATNAEIIWVQFFLLYLYTSFLTILWFWKISMFWNHDRRLTSFKATFVEELHEHGMYERTHSTLDQLRYVIWRRSESLLFKECEKDGLGHLHESSLQT